MSVQQVKKTLMVDHDLDQNIALQAQHDGSTYTKVVQDALRWYLDYRYMGEKATIIGEDIRTSMQAMVNLLERRINNRSNKLLSELAIQQGVLALVMANNLEIDPGVMDKYRQLVVEQLRQENRVFQLEEVLNDA